jgi:hypothetical protein
MINPDFSDGFQCRIYCAAQQFPSSIAFDGRHQPPADCGPFCRAGRVLAVLKAFGLWYHALALRLEIACGGDTIIHINAGLALWVVGALVLRRSMRRASTLIPMAVLEAMNEFVDWFDGAGWSLADTLKDIFWTGFWPCTLVLLLHLQRRRRKIALGLMPR